eukprot:m.168658 g.168658  ORF g.168658 m.168658 type:complete len:593 (+) comp17221_c0_seq1:314-2092(+)
MQLEKEGQARVQVAHGGDAKHADKGCKDGEEEEEKRHVKISFPTKYLYKPHRATPRTHEVRHGSICGHQCKHALAQGTPRRQLAVDALELRHIETLSARPHTATPKGHLHAAVVEDAVQLRQLLLGEVAVLGHRPHGAAADVALQVLHDLEADGAAQRENLLAADRVLLEAVLQEHADVHARLHLGRHLGGAVGHAQQERRKHVHRRAVVFAGEERVLCKVQHAEAKLEQNRWPVVHERIQDENSALEGHGVDEDSDEPRQSQHAENAQRRQVRVQLGLMLANQPLKDALIYEGAHDLLAVVICQQPLTQGTENPEGLLLATVDEQDRGHNVHRLAVTDLRVAPGVRRQNAAQSVDADFRLKGRMLRQRPVQVALNLLYGNRLAMSVVLQQLVVVAVMARRVVYGARVQHPHLAALGVWHAAQDQLAVAFGAESRNTMAKLVEVGLPHVVLQAEVWHVVGVWHRRALFAGQCPEASEKRPVGVCFEARFFGNRRHGVHAVADVGDEAPGPLHRAEQICIVGSSGDVHAARKAHAVFARGAGVGVGQLNRGDLTEGNHKRALVWRVAEKAHVARRHKEDALDVSLLKEVPNGA